MSKIRLSWAFKKVLAELESPHYKTFSVYEYFVQNHGVADPDRVNVIIRIDVDNGLHLAQPLAAVLSERGLHASFYFLTHPDRYYPLWNSQVPRAVADLGFEVGVHSDHYYESLMAGTDAISAIKADVQRLSEAIGGPVKGMTYHGHPGINALGKTNWDAYKDLPPEALDLEYNDGYLSCYIRPGVRDWTPNTTHRISDFLMGTRNIWRYYPELPVRQLRDAGLGESVHLAFHPANAVIDHPWNSPFGERMPLRPRAVSFVAQWCLVRWRLQLGLPIPKWVTRSFWRPVLRAYRMLLDR